MNNNTKKDFLVLNFVSALFTVSNKDTEDENVIKRTSNIDYKQNKRIDRRIDQIQETISKSIKDMYQLGGKDLTKWMKINLEKKIVGTLTKIQAETINLEYLAMFILYVNFAKNERNGKTLAEPMQEIQDAMQYILDTTAMFEGTAVGDLEGDMYEQAHNIIMMIKG